MIRHYLIFIIIASALGSFFLFTQSVVFDITPTSNYLLGILLESVLFIISSYFFSRKWRIAFIPFLIVISLQFINFLSTAQYIDPLTFQNLKSFRSIGNKQIIFLSFFFSCWIIFTTSLCFLKEKRSNWGIVGLFLIVLFFWKGPSPSPFYSFCSSLKRAYTESTFSLNNFRS